MLKCDILRSLEYSARIYTGGVPFCCGKTHCNINGTECCVNVNGSTITIVFRGTDSPDEWRSNLLFFKKVIPYNNRNSAIRVHSGFINAYKNEKVRDKIHSLIPKETCRIIVAGHSRGAALAVLCAVDLQYNFPDKSVEAYLFGCPRVGNRAFAKSYNKRVFKTLRIENGNDIVTKLPPAVFGFRHVGTRIGVGNTRLPLLLSAHDHYPNMYLKGIVDRMFT